MKTKNIILILLVITIVFSCDKPKEPTPIEPAPEAPKLPVLDSITREFALFKPGSWWVYKSDSIIHIINPILGYYEIPDSVDSFKVFLDTINITQVDTQNNDFYNDIKHDTVISRYFSTNFTSPLYHGVYKYSMYKSNYYEYNGEDFLYDTIYFRGNKAGTTYNNSEFYFNSSLKTTSLPEQYEEPTENGYFVEELDSMTVKGKTYYNIRHFVGVTENSSLYWYHFYWAKNIGLIKYYIVSGELPYKGLVWWELINYNVEQ